MQIRPARPADAPELVPLWEQWGYPQAQDWIAERIADWAAAPHAEVVVAEVDGAVAGVAGVSRSPHLALPGDFARLAGLAVNAAHRRRGVGAALVRACEEIARGRGCDRMEITSSRLRPEAPAFYAALGYEDRCARQARFIRPL